MSDACNSTRLSVRGVRMYNSGKMYMRKRERGWRKKREIEREREREFGFLALRIRGGIKGST